MGRVEFVNDNRKSTNNYDYPKLKLTQGEKARIVVGLEAPVVEYVHTLRAPIIANGVPQMETAKRKSGEEYQAHKKNFIGTPLCLGRGEVLDDKGIDPQSCPMCKLAVDNSDYTDPPKRRYAMHVVRYLTKGNTGEVQTPFSVELLVWSFTDKVFNRILDIRNEIEGGDLRTHDLVLGPCTNPGYQQFDITPSLKRAEWLADDNRKKIFVETFKENQIPDLTVAIGSNKRREWIDQDIDTIRSAWAEVQAYESGSPASTTDLSTDLSSLLDAEPKTDSSGWAVPGSTTPDEPVVQDDADVPTTDDVSALLGGLGDVSPEPETASEAAPESTPSTGSVDNFDDLLAGMK